MLRHGLAILSLAAALVSSDVAIAAGKNGRGSLVLNSKKVSLQCSTTGFGLPDLFTRDNIKIVETPNGNAFLVCHFIIPEGFEPKTAIVSGGPCFIEVPGGNTFTNAHGAFTATPGGTATFTCQAKASKVLRP
jgi:hypothetical protein